MLEPIVMVSYKFRSVSGGIAFLFYKISWRNYTNDLNKTSIPLHRSTINKLAEWNAVFAEMTIEVEHLDKNPD